MYITCCNSYFYPICFKQYDFQYVVVLKCVSKVTLSFLCIVCSFVVLIFVGDDWFNQLT